MGNAIDFFFKKCWHARKSIFYVLLGDIKFMKRVRSVSALEQFEDMGEFSGQWSLCVLYLFSIF